MQKKLHNLLYRRVVYNYYILFTKNDIFYFKKQISESLTEII